MKTVREVFIKAYGDIPNRATCHIGWEHKLPEPSIATWRVIIPVIDHVSSRNSRENEFSRRISHMRGWAENHATKTYPIGPDISDRCAEAFRGFFDEKYDAALDENT